MLSKKNRSGRNPVVMLGILVHFIAFYLIFFNMPNDAPIAPMEGTDQVAYMIPRYVGFFLPLPAVAQDVHKQLVSLQKIS